MVRFPSPAPRASADPSSGGKQQLKANMQYEVLDGPPPPPYQASSSTAMPMPEPRVAAYVPPEMAQVAVPAEHKSPVLPPPFPVPAPEPLPDREPDTTLAVLYLLFLDLPWSMFAFCWIWTTWLASIMLFILPIVGIPFFLLFAHSWRGLAVLDLLLTDALCRTRGPVPRVAVLKEGSWWKWYSDAWKEGLTMQSVGWSFVKMLFSVCTFTATVFLVCVAPLFFLVCLGPRKAFAPMRKMVIAHRNLARGIIKA
ncbi:hypothetical protein DFJ74DRAFT_712922 [Hyaloraphidium curvatum]|nr:hypothetical protein DFJ74DRAFT_712922 [Hyaloraphidium curvatum]